MVYHLGVDQGTTNTKVVLYNGKKIIYTVTKKIPINFTREGWVEQNANLIIDNIIFCIRQIIKISKVKISSFGTFQVVNKKERIGRNPKTKVTAKISSRKIVKFKPSQIFKKRINNER